MWLHQRSWDSLVHFQPSKYQLVSGWFSMSHNVVLSDSGFLLGNKYLNFQFLKRLVVGKGPSGRGLLPLARFDRKFGGEYSHGFCEEGCSGIWEKADISKVEQKGPQMSNAPWRRLPSKLELTCRQLWSKKRWRTQGVCLKILLEWEEEVTVYMMPRAGGDLVRLMLPPRFVILNKALNFPEYHFLKQEMS